MSAYLMNAEKIAAIAAARWAMTGYKREDCLPRMAETAAKLLDENLRSLEYRYCDSNHSTGSPAWRLQVLNDWTDAQEYLRALREALTTLSAATIADEGSPVWCDTVVRLVAEYNYQSCEHNEWPGSPGFVEAMEASHNAANHAARARTNPNGGWI